MNNLTLATIIRARENSIKVAEQQNTLARRTAMFGVPVACAAGGCRGFYKPGFKSKAGKLAAEEISDRSNLREFLRGAIDCYGSAAIGGEILAARISPPYDFLFRRRERAKQRRQTNRAKRCYAQCKSETQARNVALNGAQRQFGLS